MNRNMEILAPAGSPESLTAAVRAGADAVYLGGGRFSARAGAKNFSDAELREAVGYCHARGVKVFLAVNTLLLDDELPAALDFARFACSLPVDALLVQDLGFASLLFRHAPGLKLHASTQTGVHTPSGTKALYGLGFTRVVLARELSLAEIREIHSACPIELETFVHGALCMSVSGQCYFSSVLGSRSGNRGMCAQPCRLPFAAPGGTGHDLSLKDLSMIPRLSELSEAGAVCAKIEGRLKRPEYVAAAAAACRLAADGKQIPPELLQSLGAVFSRSGFTAGYPDGKRGREMFGVRSKEDAAAATGEVLSGLRNLYSKEFMKIPVDFTLKIKYNKPMQLTAADLNGGKATVSGMVPERAAHRALDADRCSGQLQKTGGTPFFAGETRVELDEGLAVPVSELNRMRREALDALLSRRAERPAISWADCADPGKEPHRAAPFRLRARFVGTELPENAKGLELCYVPYRTEPRRLAKLLEDGFPAAVELPRGMFGMENAVRRSLENAKAAGISHVWAGTLDAVRLALDCGFTVHGGFSLNITNTPALESYRALGVADAELSFELTLRQAAKIGGNTPRGLFLYGRLPLMLCRNCPAANSPKGCLSCKTPPELTDRRGVKFPVQCYGACSEVLNSVPLSLAGRGNDVERIDFGLLRFSTESAGETERIINDTENGTGGAAEPNSFTRGLYYRGFAPRREDA
ncbi:peptidase U32 family protein [Caproicibacter fermentans]|nr:U32 family peptidase [Caproicibacter fermentans]